MHLTEHDVMEAKFRPSAVTPKHATFFLPWLPTTLQSFAMTPKYATNFFRNTQPCPELLPSPETSYVIENKTQVQKPKLKTKNKSKGQLKWSKKKDPYEVTELLTVNAVVMYNNNFSQYF